MYITKKIIFCLAPHFKKEDSIALCLAFDAERGPLYTRLTATVVPDRVVVYHRHIPLYVD